MEQEQSPLRTGRRLNLALYDFYVARARKQRAQAIADFGQHIVRWLVGVTTGLARRGNRVGKGRIVGTRPVR